MPRFSSSHDDECQAAQACLDVMMMNARLRKLSLTAHVAASVGWVGSVATFLALALAGLRSHDAATIQAINISMELAARYVIVPFSFASLLTGLIQSLGTRWGLFRHYWVVAKLVINAFANVVLLIYMPTLTTLARSASGRHPGTAAPLSDPSPVLHSSASLILLLIATVLGVYKPKGLTGYGWRKQQERISALAP